MLNIYKSWFRDIISLSSLPLEAKIELLLFLFEKKRKLRLMEVK